MNRKGFTLAEILGVIVIISLLLILIVPTIINNISSSGEDAEDTGNEIIFNAADLYIREHSEEYPTGKSGKYCVAISDLINDGKLTEPVIDVTTGEDISNKSVLVTIYSTGSKEYEIKDAKCSDLSTSPSLSMIDFIVEPSSNDWVKSRNVTIIYPTVDGEYSARYRLDNNDWQIPTQNVDNGGEFHLTISNSTKSTLLEAQLKGNQIISGKINVVNIDSDLPQIIDLKVGNYSNYKKVDIIAKDKTSGLSGIMFTTTSTKPSENSSGWINFSSNGGEEKTYTKEFSNGNNYIWVKDKAGNISNLSTSSDGSVESLIVFKDRSYSSGYYYCPSGYTSSGSGSSMTCKKTETKSATYHPSQSINYTVTGSCNCTNGYNNGNCTNYVCKAENYPGWTVTKLSGGCPTVCPSGASSVGCSNQCRRTKSSYYSCSSGYTLSGTTCKKTTTTSPNYSSGYYYCSTGYTMLGNTCYKIS